MFSGPLVPGESLFLCPGKPAPQCRGDEASTPGWEMKALLHFLASATERLRPRRDTQGWKPGSSLLYPYNRLKGHQFKTLSPKFSYTEHFTPPQPYLLSNPKWHMFWLTMLSNPKWHTFWLTVLSFVLVTFLYHHGFYSSGTTNQINSSISCFLLQ